MKDKSKKSTYSTTFGVDPTFIKGKKRLLFIRFKEGKCEAYKEDMTLRKHALFAAGHFRSTSNSVE